MYINGNKKIPLQKYWTTLYVITLVIGLAVVAVVSAFWIRHNTFENRVNIMQMMAQQTANQIVQNETGTGEESLLQQFDIRAFLKEPGKFMQMPSDPAIFLVNANGDILYTNNGMDMSYKQLNPSLLYKSSEVEHFYSTEKQDTLYMIKEPIEVNETIIGWVVFLEMKGNLTAVKQEYTQLFIMIGALALLGWLAIYLLSKRLAKPITMVAAAAGKVKEGDYEFDLPDNIPEKEVYELIHSFKEMSVKLQKLESLRTELLAGVTHELKTPVTSISGLLQAVKEGVVVGEEAQEFLETSLLETEKMKRMVEDLLAFNSFATNAIPLNMVEYDIGELTEDIIHQWEITMNTQCRIQLNKTENNLTVNVDHIRYQQILMNLFNNAKDAMIVKDSQHILVEIQRKANDVLIKVMDNGVGIPKGEQPFIFERFYRGEAKKLEISGFGLGLPFSKMIAQALGGDLVLEESTSSGTVFVVSLPLI